MEHYRMALGISSPHIRKMPESPQRHLRSAKSTPGDILRDLNVRSPLPDRGMRTGANSAPTGELHHRGKGPSTGLGLHH